MRRWCVPLAHPRGPRISAHVSPASTHPPAVAPVCCRPYHLAARHPRACTCTLRTSGSESIEPSTPRALPVVPPSPLTRGTMPPPRAVCLTPRLHPASALHPRPDEPPSRSSPPAPSRRLCLGGATRRTPGSRARARAKRTNRKKAMLRVGAESPQGSPRAVLLPAGTRRVGNGRLSVALDWL